MHAALICASVLCVSYLVCVSRIVADGGVVVVVGTATATGGEDIWYSEATTDEGYDVTAKKDDGRQHEGFFGFSFVRFHAGCI